MAPGLPAAPGAGPGLPRNLELKRVPWVLLCLVCADLPAHLNPAAAPITQAGKWRLRERTGLPRGRSDCRAGSAPLATASGRMGTPQICVALTVGGHRTLPRYFL